MGILVYSRSIYAGYSSVDGYECVDGMLLVCDEEPSFPVDVDTFDGNEYLIVILGEIGYGETGYDQYSVDVVCEGDPEPDVHIPIVPVRGQQPPAPIVATPDPEELQCGSSIKKKTNAIGTVSPVYANLESCAHTDIGDIYSLSTAAVYHVYGDHGLTIDLEATCQTQTRDSSRTPNIVGLLVYSRSVLAYQSSPTQGFTCDYASTVLSCPKRGKSAEVKVFTEPGMEYLVGIVSRLKNPEKGDSLSVDISCEDPEGRQYTQEAPIELSNPNKKTKKPGNEMAQEKPSVQRANGPTTEETDGSPSPGSKPDNYSYKKNKNNLNEKEDETENNSETKKNKQNQMASTKKSNKMKTNKMKINNKNNLKAPKLGKQNKTNKNQVLNNKKRNNKKPKNSDIKKALKQIQKQKQNLIKKKNDESPSISPTMAPTTIHATPKIKKSPMKQNNKKKKKSVLG